MFETTEVVEGAVPVYIRDGLEDCSFFWMKKQDDQHAEIVACVPPLVGGRKAWFSIRDKFEKTNKFHFLEDDSLAEQLLEEKSLLRKKRNYCKAYMYAFGWIPAVSTNLGPCWIFLQNDNSVYRWEQVDMNDSFAAKEWEEARQYQNPIVRGIAHHAADFGKWEY